MNTEDYVSYPIAIKLKTAGFDEPCRDFYWTSDGVFKHTDALVHKNSEHCTTMVAAPTLWHAQKWLREKGIAVSVQASEIQGELWYSADIITTKGINELVDGGFDYMDYEAALSAGLSAALELIETKGV